MNSIVCNNTQCTPSPWNGFQELESQLERVLYGPRGRSPQGAWAPAVDIHETADAFVLQADLPGLKREEIEVQVVENKISVRGNRKREERSEEKGFRRYERAEGHFERSFRIKDGIDPTKVEASFEDGVLTVTLPKPEEAKPRSVEVKIR